MIWVSFYLFAASMGSLALWCAIYWLDSRLVYVTGMKLRGHRGRFWHEMLLVLSGVLLILSSYWLYLTAVFGLIG